MRPSTKPWRHIVTDDLGRNVTFERCEHRWYKWAKHKCFRLKNHEGYHECACGNKHEEP